MTSPRVSFGMAGTVSQQLSPVGKSYHAGGLETLSSQSSPTVLIELRQSADQKKLFSISSRNVALLLDISCRPARRRGPCRRFLVTSGTFHGKQPA